jgi:hypothetical protein
MASVVRSLSSLVVRRITRFALLACLLVLTRPTTHSAAVDADRNDGAVAQSYYPEVRLRKLHLVRPDLIPYPISYEVYC